MAREPSSVFLERGSYRRRRVMDAVRLVVVVGAVLWMVPLLWPSADTAGSEPVSMSSALFYVFGVWFVLITVSAVLVSRLRRVRGSDTGKDAQQ